MVFGESAYFMCASSFYQQELTIDFNLADRKKFDNGTIADALIIG